MFVVLEGLSLKSSFTFLCNTKKKKKNAVVADNWPISAHTLIPTTSNNKAKMASMIKLKDNSEVVLYVMPF